MKNITLILLLLFLYNCGYTSVYKNQETQDFAINVTGLKGDREMNNLIKNEINLYSNKNSIKIFNIEINTDYKKTVITKDSAGNITDYTLAATSTFTINLENLTKTVQFTESINIKNLSDTFEQNNYEKNIKRNFASSLREKLISEILSIDDN